MKKIFKALAAIGISAMILAGCGSSGKNLSTVASSDAENATVVSFETTDLEGNKVSSSDLFGDHKVTFINVWATWCDPCKEELGALDAINKELEAKNCQVIGVCIDTLNDESAVASAKSILENEGATYINLVANQEMYDQLNQSVMPVSYLVDSEGRLLMDPLKGANPDKYVSKVDAALETLGE